VMFMTPMAFSSKILIAKPYLAGDPISAGHDRPMHRSNKPSPFPLVSPSPGVEWWCNTNNHLDWHIDKDEVNFRENGRHSLPLLSKVFYPHVSCIRGELLAADKPPMQEGQTVPPPRFHSVISIPPAVNRLVVFSPGILHRINQFEGESYSIAANIWQSEPLTTQDSAPPA